MRAFFLAAGLPAGLAFLVPAAVPHSARAEIIEYENNEARTGPIELTEDAILTIDEGTATQSGAISEVDGSFGITKTGAGTLVIQNVDEEFNSYTGSTVVQAGTLRMGTDYAIPITAVVIEGGAALDLDGHSTEFTSLAGEGTLDFGAGGGQLYIHSGGSFAGAVTGDGAFLYNGPGTFTLSGNSNFAGYLGVYDGRLISNGSSTFGELSLYADFEIAGGSTVINDTVHVTWTDPVTLEVTGGGSLEIAGGLVIAFYDGESGKVVLSGSGSQLTATDGVFVGGNGTLAGNGLVYGDTTVEGTLSPGLSAGLMSFDNDLMLCGTAAIVMELGGLDPADYDRIAVGGGLTYGGTLQIQLIDGFIPQVGDAFDLFDFTGSPTGDFADIGFAIPGFAADFDTATGILTIIAVPEPSACALAIAALLAAIPRRRRTSR